MILLKTCTPQIFPQIYQTHRIHHKKHAKTEREPIDPLKEFLLEKLGLKRVVRYAEKPTLQPDLIVPKKVFCQTTSTIDLTIMLGNAFNARYMSISRPSMYSQIQLNPSTRSIIPEFKGFINDEEYTLSDEILPFAVGPHYTKELVHVANKKEIKREIPRTFSKTTHRKTRINSTIISYSKLAQSLSLTIYNNKSTSHINQRNKRSYYQPAHKTQRKNSKHSPIFSSPKSENFKPWKCESKEIWKDLGPDHFPRYLRTIECITKKCFYSFYNCVPRAFTVKILKRRRKEKAGYSCIDSTSDEIQYENQYKLAIENKGVMQNFYNSFLGDGKLQKEFMEEWLFEERSVVFCCDCGHS
ncbi:unnamed protein product [Gordionus sp. m RMFG-2023]